MDVLTFQDNDFDEYKDIIDAQFPRELENVAQVYSIEIQQACSIFQRG